MSSKQSGARLNSNYPWLPGDTFSHTTKIGFKRRVSLLLVVVSLASATLLLGNMRLSNASATTVEVITTVAGTPPTSGYGPPGPATSTQLDNPQGVAVDGSGNLYVADTGNCVIWKISGGTASIFAGDHTCGGTGVGGLATAGELDYPDALAFDQAGNLYVDNKGDCTIEEVSHVNSDISLVAGTGTCHLSTSGGLTGSVSLASPVGLAVDSSGNIYIADSTACVVWKVSGTEISDFVGKAGTCGTTGPGGPADAAEIGRVSALTMDPSQNLYVGDLDNCSVWEVSTSSPVLTLFAGQGGDKCGDSGDGYPASFSVLGQVTGLASDSLGDIFISVSDWCDVREVSAQGFISTLVGISGVETCGYAGDGEPPGSTELFSPHGLVANASGDLYIADSSNNAVRELNSVVPTITSITPSLGPTTGDTQVTLLGTGYEGTSAVFFGATRVLSFQVVSNTVMFATSPGMPTGTYDITVINSQGTSETSLADQFTYTNSTTTSSSSSSTTSPSSSTSTTTSSGPTSSTSTTSPTSTSSPASTTTDVSPKAVGYLEVASDGGVFAFGDADFLGSMGGRSLVAPIVGLAITPDGHGYLEVASDGGVFAFGDASFLGSMGGRSLVAPIVGLD